MSAQSSSLAMALSNAAPLVSAFGKEGAADAVGKLLLLARSTQLSPCFWLVSSDPSYIHVAKRMRSAVVKDRTETGSEQGYNTLE